MKLKQLFSLVITSIFLFSSCSNKNGDHEFYIVSLPTQTSFNVGDSFTSEGLTLMDLNSYEDVYNYSLTYKEGYVFKAKDAGNRKVTISKHGYKSISYDITVTSYPILELSGNPKTEFNVGEFFSTEGLIVSCGEEMITDYKTSISTHNILRQAGEYEVVVSKEYYGSASYKITVYPEKQLFVDTLPNKVKYAHGDAFNVDGLVVIDERNNEITDYTLSIEDGTILKMEGAIDIIVSKVGYITDSFAITIDPPSGELPTNHDFTIYYLNDTHGSYARLDEFNEAGMAYISTYLKNKKSDNPDDTLILSGGDMFQGGYESNETRGQIMVDAMNEIGFDAMVLGNHEFDWGEEYIYQFATGLNCDIVSANTFYSSGDKTTRPSWVKPYTIVTKGNLRVGIIGGAEENMGSHVVGNIGNQFYFPSPISYVKYYSNELRIKHQCDIIVAGFHEGGFEGYSGDPTKYVGLTQIDPTTNKKYVDCMFFAHDHLRKQGVYEGVPYLEAGCNGINIGELTFNIDSISSYHQIKSYSTNIVWAGTTCKTYDPAFNAIDNKYRSVVDKGSEVVYDFTYSYNSDDFTDVVCESMLWYVNANPSEFDNITVSMASHNAGGIRSDVSSGEMTLRLFVKMFPFDNKLCIQRCTKTNINNYLNYDYYHTVGTPVYLSDNCARVASINYITESAYASRYQVDYVAFDITVKEILYTYLIENIDPNL